MRVSTGESTTSPLRTLIKESGRTANWALDPTQSSVRFKTNSIWGVVRVAGTFRELNGHGTISPLGEVQGSLTIASSSIDTNNTRRDRHLRSTDFLASEDHQNIVFALNRVCQIDSEVVFEGLLTIRDRTLPITFPAIVAVAPSQLFIDATVQVNRADFGLTWNVLGMISKESVLTIHAEFVPGVAK